jgi:hypothetical protein
MAKHHRKSHRKSHRKGSRSAHRKSHRKSHRKTYRRQHGGSSCSAMPRNFASFQQQRGGMAPITTGDAYLLDAATRVQAEVGPLDKSFAELPSVIPKQMGGRRHRRSAHRKGSRKAHRKGSRSAHRKGSRSAHRKGSRSAHRKGSRKAHRKSHKGSRRQQRGGMSPFDAPGMLLDRAAYSADGTNPQFRTEGSVNPLYGEFRGAQLA